MRIVVDECTGPSVAAALQSDGHDVVSIYDSHRGWDDGSILRFAAREERLLITNDKDFGERVYRLGEAHFGVILLRLTDATIQFRIQRARAALALLGDIDVTPFVVVTDDSVRIAGG